MTIQHEIKTGKHVEVVNCPGDETCKICYPYVPSRGGGRFHFWHRYKTIRDTTAYAYQVCKVCGRRRIERQSVALAGPKDVGWLKTGEWTQIGPPPRQGGVDGIRRV